MNKEYEKNIIRKILICSSTEFSTKASAPVFNRSRGKTKLWFNVIIHETGTYEASSDETRKLGCWEDLGKFNEPFWLLSMKCHW